MTHEALEKEVAALTKDKEDAWELIEEFRHENSEQRCQLAAAQATNERLREALKFYMVPPIGQLNDHCIAAAKLGMAALALPNDTTALDARLAQEREKCAMLAQVAGAMHVADTIRSMSK